MGHFSIQELTRSETAAKLGIDNAPSATIRRHIEELIRTLELLRAAWAEECKQHGWGTPAIEVTSGYRSPRLNRAVGGVYNSAHLTGWAADLKPVNGRQADFERWASGVFGTSGARYDQLIIERSCAARWLHFGLKDLKGRQRMQRFSVTK